VPCAEVRPLLSDLAEGTPHVAGPVEAHIAGCAECSRELMQYRGLIEAMGRLRDVLDEPAPGFVERVLLEAAPEEQRVRRLQRVAAAAANPRVMISVGGAVVGATAVGLLWWRTARRTLAGSAGPAAASS